MDGHLTGAIEMAASKPKRKKVVRNKKNWQASTTKKKTKKA